MSTTNDYKNEETLAGSIACFLIALFLFGSPIYLGVVECINQEKDADNFAAVKNDLPVIADAIDAWAELNDGVYPDSLTQQLHTDGRTPVDFLPDGQLLVNHWTGKRSEPSTANWWTRPGNITYNVDNNEGKFWLWGWDRPDFGGAFGIQRHFLTRNTIADSV